MISEEQTLLDYDVPSSYLGHEWVDGLEPRALHGDGQHCRYCALPRVPNTEQKTCIHRLRAEHEATYRGPFHVWTGDSCIFCSIRRSPRTEHTTCPKSFGTNPCGEIPLGEVTDVDNTTGEVTAKIF